MSARTKGQATYADLEAVPPHLVAEILHGSLETHPRPAPRHAVAANALSGELSAPFQRGRSGPGGWVFMTEPEFHLGAHIVAPDMAGWGRERLPRLPDSPMELHPDWVCEILSPATEKLDRGVKREIYAQSGVAYLWLLDPRERVLEAFQLVAGQWLLVGVATGSDSVALAPFDAISFSLDALFPFDEPSPPAGSEASER